MGSHGWLALLLLVGPAARADDAPHSDGGAVRQVALGFTTLKLMRDKHVITQAEYDSALHDLGDTIGGQADESTTLMVSRFSATLYGFVELVGIWDSTESLSDVPGNCAPDTT